jgi:hypothetical protein
MPEFRHYTFFAETIEILRDVSATHALKLIPEQPALAEPRLETFDRFDPEVATRLARFGVVQLEGAFTKHPLQFKQRDGGSAAGTYYLDDSIGPRLHWTLPGQTGEHPPVLGPGSLSYYTSYRDPMGGREPPSPELIAAFRAVVKTMKRHMVAVLARGNKVWVGRETKRRWDAREVIIDP